MGLFCFFSIFFTFSSDAFQVSPIELSFQNKGSQTTQSIQVFNSGKETIPVEIQAFERKHDLSGKETRTPTKDFLIFPPQFMLKPGQKRTVRLTWLGVLKEGSKTRSLDIKSEKPYRLKVRQVPVNLKKKAQKGIKLIYEYVASLYVVPPKVKSNLVVESGRVVSSKKVELVLHNRGGQHALLKDFKIKYKPSPKSSYVNLGELSDNIRATNIMAGGKRKILLSLKNKISLKQAGFAIDSK